MRKRRRCSTRRDPKATPAPDLVNRDFTAPAPNRLWVADISRIPTWEGPLWLATVRDAFSRRIVGWKASQRADTDLVVGALDLALWTATSSRTGWCSTPITARRADSTGRRNTSTVRSCDGSTETAVGHGGPVTDALAWSAAGGAA
jgi:transposase InsO family protein